MYSGIIFFKKRIANNYQNEFFPQQKFSFSLKNLQDINMAKALFKIAISELKLETFALTFFEVKFSLPTRHWLFFFILGGSWICQIRIGFWGLLYPWFTEFGLGSAFWRFHCWGLDKVCPLYSFSISPYPTTPHGSWLVWINMLLCI